MLSRRAGVLFTVSDLAKDWGSPDLVNVNLGDHNDTFHTFISFGSSDEGFEFDWFNNPYISANVYSLDENYTVKFEPDIKLETCRMEDLKSWVPVRSYSDIAHSLCFEDLSNVELTRSWGGPAGQHNVFISIDGCD